MTTTYKLVTSVIDARLTKHQEQYNYMQIDQRGCSTGLMGCIDNLLIDKAVLKDAVHVNYFRILITFSTCKTYLPVKAEEKGNNLTS